MALKITNGSWCQEFDISGKCIKQWFEAGDVEWEDTEGFSQDSLDSFYHPFEVSSIS